MSADRVTILKHDCWVSSVYSCYTSLAFSKISAKRLNIFKILHWLSQFTVIFIFLIISIPFSDKLSLTITHHWLAHADEITSLAKFGLSPENVSPLKQLK